MQNVCHCPVIVFDLSSLHVLAERVSRWIALSKPCTMRNDTGDPDKH